MKNLILAIFTIGIFTGCASNYNRINPNNTLYISSERQTEGVKLSYKYGVLKESQNKKYSKKEDKSGLQVVAIKVKNESDKPITLNENYAIYAGGTQITPMPTNYVVKEIKQGVAIYILYMLFTPTVLTTGNNETPIGYALGPGLTLLNIGTASSANAKFRKDLENFSLIGKSIAPGETVYGLMGFQNTGYAPLKAKLID
jgi:hypothetical protein